MGVAAFPIHGVAGETVLRAADAALYRAKDSGRDRVMVAEGGGISAVPSG
jgi:GGDEF domain-containing protein